MSRRKWLQAAAVLVVIAVLGGLSAPYFLHPAPGVNASPSKTGPAQTVPSGSAGVAQTSPRPSPAAGQTWKALASSDIAAASWSADGQWLAVWDSVTNGTADQRHLRLFDKAGNAVRNLDGDQLVWVESSRFVLYKSSSPGTGSLESADSTDVAAVNGDFSNALTNYHGAVALASANSNPANETFIVWTPTGTSRVLAGEPEAWSADGSKLAVWHYLTPGQGVGGQPSGWVEVLSWPDLRQIASTGQAVSSERAPMAFDPTGQYLVMPADSSHAVLDITTGQMVGPSGAAVGDSPAWDQNSNLIAASGDGSGSVTLYPVRTGGSSSTKPNLGDRSAASPDGSTVLYYFSQRQGPVTLVRGGTSRTIDVPGAVQPFQPDPQVSVEGNLVVVCMVGNGLQVLLLVG
jgi:hypothetical protein